MTFAPDALSTLRLGVAPYSHGLRLQRGLHAEVSSGARPHTLVLLEHPHVYTLGRRGSQDDILADARTLTALGAEVRHADRGGEVTYHGPGQLVGYPIVNLRRWGGGPLRFVRTLERALIDALARFGVEAESDGRPTGVWVGERKIAAIGVKVARRATMHGFALNVCADLSYFDHIVPCGMRGARATSLSRELGRNVSVDEVAPSVADRFASAFGFSANTAAANEKRGAELRAPSVV